MKADNWERINELFHASLEREPGERAAFLGHACAGDEGLRLEVESLLASHDPSDNFIEALAPDLAAGLLAESRARLATGQSVGNYRVMALLGTGGMGEVYLTEDTRLGRRVALKLLPEQFTKDPDRMHRFESEARAASSLNHPNIITIHEVGQVEDAPFIITEFIEGKTLRQQMAAAKLRLREVLDVAIQVASALEAAHKAGILHRDIKPENIMIRPDGYVKILDFGLAKLVEQKNTSILGLEDETGKQNQTATGLILGTVNYMSPEQVKGEKVDERTDIFSLGVVIYEMIAGRTPFVSDSAPETIANLINTEPPPLSRFAATAPDELQRIVSKMLRKNRDGRHQTISDVLTDLKGLLERLRSQGKLEESLSPETENRTGKSAVSTSEVNDLTLEQLTEQTAKLRSTAATSIAQKKRRNYLFVLAGLISVVLVLIFVVSLNSWFRRSKSLEFVAPVLSAPFSSEKLSTSGKVVHAVISPDGKNVAYTSGIRGKESVWLRQLESANNIEIIPPSDVIYGRLAFSPDGNSIYLTRRSRNVEGAADIYRVPIFGGVPSKIVNKAQPPFSVSPDGGKISFVRSLKGEGYSLWFADTDGGNERKLVSRPGPFRIGNNQISPDGKTVAFAVGRSDNAANEFGLVEVNVDNGAERELSKQKFFNIHTLAWLPNQNGLLMAASRIPNRNFLLWQVSVATGDTSPLTKDSESYSDLSLDKAAGVIVATQTKADFNLLLYKINLPLDKRGNLSDKRILADARQVRFTPNGKIVFSSLMSGNAEIWSINADGSEQRQLTNDPADDAVPVSSPDNRFIFFISNRTGEAQVWRMNDDGSNQTQITFKDGGYPIFVSPDGHWVYYHHGSQRTLWRVSTKGGEEQLVLNKEKYRFAFSPDGSRVAFSERRAGETSLVIVSLADGRIIKTFTYADKYADQGEGLELEWLPDGKSVVYILADNEFDNHTLWLQPLDAKTPQKVADLGEEVVNSLAISPDGKSFAVVQGRWKHDAVLIKGLR